MTIKTKSYYHIVIVVFTNFETNLSCLVISETYCISILICSECPTVYCTFSAIHGDNVAA